MSKAEIMDKREVSFKRLIWQSLPEMWKFQLLAAVLLTVIAGGLTYCISWVAETRGSALTTANFKEFLFSWRSPAILILGAILVFLYIVIEIFAHIYMTKDILEGEPVSLRGGIKRGLASLMKFMDMWGIAIILYIFIAVPLWGIGFSISLTETFYIPNFIMEFIESKPLYGAVYGAAIILLIVIGFNSIFAIHGVLIDGKKPREALKSSAEIIKKNRKVFLKETAKIILILFLIQVGAWLLFRALPPIWLEEWSGNEIPTGYVIDWMEKKDFSMVTDMDLMVVLYRFSGAFVVLAGAYFNSITALLAGAYFMVRMTRFYMEFTGRGRSRWKERPRKRPYIWSLAVMTVTLVAVFAGSLVIGIFYNQIFDRDVPVGIIAHRAGGVMASENSMAGIYAALEKGCYGSEIDIQRTKDGHYVVNHDSDFKRVAGVAKSSQDMTLAEIKKMKIKDTTGGSKEHQISTLEEMLDAVKGRMKLFVELKGSTADNRMVDDVVKMAGEKDCVEDVVLISLDYKIIDYAESKYPEFETGTLFFAGLGNVARLNCDFLIMEEQTATTNRINQIHLADKKAMVWTVNTREGMLKFLDSDIDAIITDQVELVSQVEKTLKNRDEFAVLRDKLGNFWG